MTDKIKSIGIRYARGSINIDEFKQKIAEIGSNSPYNKHNLGKALGAGLQDGDCSDERKHTAKKAVKEIDPEIYEGLDDPYNGAFGY